MSDQQPDSEDDGLEAELAPFVERVCMALAEAGYPDAHVYVENGVWIEGVPEQVADKALDICGAAR